MILCGFSSQIQHCFTELQISRDHMALTRADIENIAQLARLQLNETEIPVYQQSLSSILDFVGELNRADTRGVEPMAHPLAGLAQRLRADAVTESDQHERYQANAPKVEAGLYLVPRVIE
jgi:aspartyl-tRNA(Asn)/glutamyl-tRNA(Gln) amidotransferase subunit C